MDDWRFEQLEPWLKVRQSMPVGPLFCVISGRTRGRAWPPSAARANLKRRAARAGLRRRFVQHQLRHAHALELAHEGVPLNVIQRQLGHRNPRPPAPALKGDLRAASAANENSAAPHFGGTQHIPPTRHVSAGDERSAGWPDTPASPAVISSLGPLSSFVACASARRYGPKCPLWLLSMPRERTASFTRWSAGRAGRV